MYFMYLYILFADDRIEKHRVKRFSDLSQTKSKYYYYEEPHDTKGQGKSFLRDEIRCFEVSPYELTDWEAHLTAKEPQK